jgi:hypothetical protein
MASLTADLRITQVVNGVKGVHCMIEKRYLGRQGAAPQVPSPRGARANARASKGL